MSDYFLRYDKFNSNACKIALAMGSISDWDTVRYAAQTLDSLGIFYEKRIISAHRTPDLMFSFAETAKDRGIQVIIAAAGGAAHLPGMIAAKTVLPVIGVPVQSRSLQGLDSLLSIVQMPAGVPVATVAIGRAGATNAALLACKILALSDESLQVKLQEYSHQMAKVSIDSQTNLEQE